MDSFKKIWGLRNLRLCVSKAWYAAVICWCLVGRADAQTCIVPTRPFVPSDPDAAEEFRDLIKQDFEFYIQDIQAYIRCVDEERARAFEEARQVSQEYGRFLQATEN